MSVDEPLVSSQPDRAVYTAVRKAVELLDTEALRSAGRSHGRWRPDYARDA